MWTPAGFSCHRTLLVPRARQETMDSVALCCCFWKEGRLGKRRGKLYCPLRGDAHILHLHLVWKHYLGRSSFLYLNVLFFAFISILTVGTVQTFNFDSKV